MRIQWKLLPIIFILMSSQTFVRLECRSNLLSDVIYEDIQNLNATCHGSDSCLEPRAKDSLEQYNCNCGSYCSLFGTCCVDSKYRKRYAKPLENIECYQYRDYDNSRDYFFPIINDCNTDLQSHNTTVELCQSYSIKDPFLKIPVTDPVTGITYKNHYCHACNDNYGEEQPIPWNLELTSKSERVIRSTIPDLHYDTTKYSWVMDYGEANATVVYLGVSMPEELKVVVPFCFNFRIISNCARDWTDDDIRNKCTAYMALARIKSSEGYKRYYQNPHCAICNYQSVENIVCFGKDENTFISLGKGGDFFVRLFHIHNQDRKCEENMVYDNFAKKCRKILRSKRRLL